MASRTRMDGNEVWRAGVKPRVVTPDRQSSRRQLGSTSIRWVSPGRQRTDHARPQAFTEGVGRPYSTLQTNSRAPSRKHRPASSHTRPVSASQRPTKSQFSRQTSAPPKLQRLPSSHSLHSSSLSGLSGLSNPIKLAPRPQSSLGFQRWSSCSENSRAGLTPPEGFDLASYVKQNKSAKGIIIGRNGEPTKDEYFDAYLTQCEEELCREQAEGDSDSVSAEEVISPSSKPLQVPLCWEDQIAQTEPESLRCSTPKSHENSLQAVLERRQQLMDHVKVKLMLNEHCLLDTTPISLLQYSPAEESLQPDSSQAKTTVEITSLETPHNRLNQQQSDHTLEILLYSGSDLTQQELEKQTYDVILSSIKPDADCLSHENSQSQTICNKAFINLIARRVIKHVSVIQVSMERQAKVFQTEAVSTYHDLNSVTVMYGQPRSLLFIATLLSSTTDSTEPASPQQSSLFLEQLQSQLMRVREKERVPGCGSFDVPDKFFYKRTSYCNQEDDEDRTDLAVISSYVPDLRLTEDEKDLSHITAFNTPSLVHRPTSNQSKSYQGAGSNIPSTATQTNRKSSSSVQTSKIIVVPSGERRKYRPVPLQYTSSVGSTNQHPNTSNADQQRTQTSHRDYSMIAGNWLGQYFNDQ